MVLAANLISGLVPPVDRLLAAAPVLVALLVLGTGLVLLGALRRPRRR